MKVLSVIIAHPLRKISGATNAGRDLSIATAAMIDLELAIMWDANEHSSVGRLGIRHMKSTNRLGPFTNLLPRFVRVPLYDSHIPKLIRPGNYNLVHIHNLVPTFAAERVAKACKRAGIPYVISTHGFEELSRYSEINSFGKVKSALAKFAITRPFERIVRGASALFALSDREHPLLARMGVSPSSIHVVTNGVNEYYLQDPSHDELAEVRLKHGFGDDPILLFFGSLHAYKGVDTFLASLRHVSGRFQPVVAGRFKDENEKKRLLDKAQLPTALASRVIFTGAVSDQDLRALYHSAAVFVYPTRGDTLPLVLLEAMACRLPIVSTRVSGIPFAVQADSGILIEPGDPAAVAQAVDALLANPERRQRMAAAGRKRVEGTFRWSASARHAVDGYRAVLKQVQRAHGDIEEPQKISAAGD